MISPLAYVSPKAQIGKNVTIDAFAYIDDNVIIGDNCHVFPSAVIGAVPQDLKYKGEETWTIIGDNCVLREFVTVHRGTASKGKTVVGSNNLLMENMHVGHDCVLGSGLIIGNSTKLAGEVVIDDNAILSGCVLVHQFCHIGGYVMVQGGSRSPMDIPPYIIAGRDPLKYCGLNIVGLRRRGFSKEQIDLIHNTYRLLYNTGTLKEGIEEVRKTLPMTKEVEYILNFVETSQRGIIR